MKYIVRTKDENLRLVDYWLIDEKEEKQALALASNDTRTRTAYDWSMSLVSREFSPTEGGWKHP
jgi:hypothetical protein